MNGFIMIQVCDFLCLKTLHRVGKILKCSSLRVFSDGKMDLVWGGGVKCKICKNKYNFLNNWKKLKKCHKIFILLFSKRGVAFKIFWMLGANTYLIIVI